MLALHFPFSVSDSPSPSLARALASVTQRIEQHPELMAEHPGLGHPYFTLSTELTDTYGKPAMLWDANAVQIAFRKDGAIYSLSEVAGKSSGGWMGSCIAEGRLEAFARAWLEQTDPSRTEQIALF